MTKLYLRVSNNEMNILLESKFGNSSWCIIIYYHHCPGRMERAVKKLTYYTLINSIQDLIWVRVAKRYLKEPSFIQVGELGRNEVKEVIELVRKDYRFSREGERKLKQILEQW